MWCCKGFCVAGLFLVFCTRSVWPQDLFSSLNFARNELTQYSRGSTRTVNMKIPLKTAMKVDRKLSKGRKRRPMVYPKLAVGPAGPRPRPGPRPWPTTAAYLMISARPTTLIPMTELLSPEESDMFARKYSRKRTGKRRRPGHGVYPGGPRRRPGPTPLPRRKARLEYKNQTRTYRARSTPSNKFLEALNTIERAMAETHAAAKSGIPLRYSPRNIIDIRNKTIFAASKRSYQVSRALLGKALWMIKNSRTKKAGKSQGQESTQTTEQTEVSTFMGQLKSSMEAEKPGMFDEFMAVHGDVTLMFAIDTTGSMSAEIATAKRIAVDVINHPRKNPVNYILSPFNDPSTGPVTFRNMSQGKEFVDDIRQLRARGGGDCAELAIKGIFDALQEGPEWGSPMYVFTDAPPKDAAPENVQEVKALAEYLGVTINFFTTDLCKSRHSREFQSYMSGESFKKIAEATSGQMLSLSSAMELQQLKALTGSVLGGSNIICTAGSKRTRGLAKSYQIKVDDSIEQMSVCITSRHKNRNRGIVLKDPEGNTVTSNRTSLSKVSVYQIANPKTGAWTLEVPSSVGQHEFFVKSTSDTNIDFEHYFLFTFNSTRQRTMEVPLSYPLKGLNQKLVITVAGSEKVNRQTVAVELISQQGEHLRDVQLRSVDTAGVRYVATTFTPPTQPFRLKLKGNTKTGHAFERISRNIVEPKTVMLRVMDSATDYTLKPGQNVSILFQVYNAATKPQTVNIRVRDKLSSASRPQHTIGPRQPKLIPVRYQAPRDAPDGATVTAVVTISVAGRNEKVSQVIQLIVNSRL